MVVRLLSATWTKIAPATITGPHAQVREGRRVRHPATGTAGHPEASTLPCADETSSDGFVSVTTERPPDPCARSDYQRLRSASRTRALGDTDRAAWPIGISGETGRSVAAPDVPGPAAPRHATRFSPFVTTYDDRASRCRQPKLEHYVRLDGAAPRPVPIVEATPGGFNHRDPRSDGFRLQSSPSSGRAAEANAAKPPLDEEEPQELDPVLMSRPRSRRRRSSAGALSYRMPRLAAAHALRLQSAEPWRSGAPPSLLADDPAKQNSLPAGKTGRAGACSIASILCETAPGVANKENIAAIIGLHASTSISRISRRTQAKSIDG